VNRSLLPQLCHPERAFRIRRARFWRDKQFRRESNGPAFLAFLECQSYAPRPRSDRRRSRTPRTATPGLNLERELGRTPALAQRGRVLLRLRRQQTHGTRPRSGLTRSRSHPQQQRPRLRQRISAGRLLGTEIGSRVTDTVPSRETVAATPLRHPERAF
jgi:hypothetical protein